MTGRRLVARDLRRAWASGGIVAPLVFFLLVAVLFPFAIGPDQALLRRVGAGVVWTAALLAALLPVERLVGPDLEAGVIDQLVIAGWSETAIAAAKIAAHWLGFAPALMAATAVLAALFDLAAGALIRLEWLLLLGTPGLAALGVATAALTAGLRGAGAVAGLVMLPIAMPLLVFGAGDGQGGGGGAGGARLLAAVSLLLIAGAPFVAGAAMRSARG